MTAGCGDGAASGAPHDHGVRQKRNYPMQNHIVRSLHDDHMATMALLAQLEALLGKRGPTAGPDTAAPPVAAFLRELTRAVELELGPHFAFEESHLFPFLAEAGAEEMAVLLTREHAELLPRARRLAELARQGLGHGLGPAGWAEFHAVGAGLPALEAALDAETDGRFATEYAALR